MSFDWYPLWNSLRIAAISCVLVFFTGIFFAYYAAKLPRTVKGVLDVILTLPMVLPPTVCGYFLLLVFGVKRPLGIFLLKFGVKFVMTWYGGVLAAAVVAFPLMYRTARGAFESFDKTLAYSGQTLGLSNTYIFWRIRMPACRQGILAGTVLAFARALGEYGATSMLIGYTPGKTATISTTVYQLWRTNDEKGAMFWVLINLAISTVVVRKDILVVGYLQLYFFQLVEYLLLFETRKPAYGHLRDVIRLNVRKPEPRTEPLLTLGNVSRGLHDVDDLIDVVESYLQALQYVSAFLSLAKIELRAAGDDLYLEINILLQHFL